MRRITLLDGISRNQRGFKLMQSACRTVLIGLCSTALAVGTLAAADVDAHSVSYDLDIPAESLTAALQTFAIASHHKLLYKADLTTGKTSRALKGNFTAEEAIQLLLTGTGLTYEITGSSVVLIKPMSRESSQAADSPRSGESSTQNAS